MRAKLFILALGWGMAVAPVSGENTVEQLEKAQTGIVQASWPKKPGQQLSPLSGRAMDWGSSSPRVQGQGREIPLASHLMAGRLSMLADRPSWEGGSGDRRAGEILWEGRMAAPFSLEENPRFSTGRDAGLWRIREERELVLNRQPDWTGRTSRFAHASTGEGRGYVGRLTRVRETVRREAEDTRDLGAGKREQFRPEEVEKILSRPPGKAGLLPTARSSEASPPAAAGN